MAGSSMASRTAQYPGVPRPNIQPPNSPNGGYDAHYPPRRATPIPVTCQLNEAGLIESGADLTSPAMLLMYL